MGWIKSGAGTCLMSNIGWYLSTSQKKGARWGAVLVDIINDSNAGVHFSSISLDERLNVNQLQQQYGVCPVFCGIFSFNTLCTEVTHDSCRHVYSDDDGQLNL